MSAKYRPPLLARLASSIARGWEGIRDHKSPFTSHPEMTEPGPWIGHPMRPDGILYADPTTVPLPGPSLASSGSFEAKDPTDAELEAAALAGVPCGGKAPPFGKRTQAPLMLDRRGNAHDAWIYSGDRVNDPGYTEAAGLALLAAERTLKRMGYAWRGGEEWAPPYVDGTRHELETARAALQNLGFEYTPGEGWTTDLASMRKRSAEIEALTHRADNAEWAIRCAIHCDRNGWIWGSSDDFLLAWRKGDSTALKCVDYFRERMEEIHGTAGGVSGDAATRRNDVPGVSDPVGSGRPEPARVSGEGLDEARAALRSRDVEARPLRDAQAVGAASGSRFGDDGPKPYEPWRTHRVGPNPDEPRKVRSPED